MDNDKRSIKLKNIDVPSLRSLKDHKGFKQFLLAVEDAMNGAFMDLRVIDNIQDIYRTQGEIRGYEFVVDLLDSLIAQGELQNEELLKRKDKPNA